MTDLTLLSGDGALRRVPLVVYSGAPLESTEQDDLRLGRTVFLRKVRTTPDVLLASVLDLLDSATGFDAPDRVEPDPS